MNKSSLRIVGSLWRGVNGLHGYRRSRNPESVRAWVVPFSVSNREASLGCCLVCSPSCWDGCSGAEPRELELDDEIFEQTGIDELRILCSAGDAARGWFCRDLQQVLCKDVGHRSASPRRHDLPDVALIPQGRPLTHKNSG